MTTTDGDQRILDGSHRPRDVAQLVVRPPLQLRPRREAAVVDVRHEGNAARKSTQRRPHRGTHWLPPFVAASNAALASWRLIRWKRRASAVYVRTSTPSRSSATRMPLAKVFSTRT